MLNILNVINYIHLFLVATYFGHPREDNTNAYTTKVNDINKSEITAKMIRWKYPTKEINNKNNDVPKGTEDKMYSVVGSPIRSVA
jgi:hypothetical protein